MKYDFIEIGTSDMDTLLEFGDGKRGLSIEPIQTYLDRLPNVDGIIKVCAAISNTDGTANVFWVDPEDIVKHGLSLWLRGTNTLFAPHPTAVRELTERGLLNLMKHTPCRLMTWATLVREYEVEAVDYIKIDTEGHDWIIVNSILTSGPTPRPKYISFECNWLLASRERLIDTRKRLEAAEYEFIPRPDAKQDDGDLFYRDLRNP